MWTSRLFWKMFLLYGGLIFLIAATFPIALARWERANVIDQVRGQLVIAAEMIRSRVEPILAAQDLEQLQSVTHQIARITEVRLTIVAEDGEVLAESEAVVSAMQNHSNRPELIAAGNLGRGEAIRRSPTLGIDLFYLALPIYQDKTTIGFVRVASKLQSIDRKAHDRQQTLWLVAGGIVFLAAPIVYFTVGSLVRPLSQLTASSRAISAGNYQHPVTLDSHDELGELAGAFNQMRNELARRVAELEDHNRRMSVVLGGMVEGVLAVDADRRVLVVNQAARQLFNCPTEDVTGRPLLEVARNVDVDSAVTQVFNGQNPCQTEFSLPGPMRRTISLFATRLSADPSPGVVIVLHDVTELRRLENLRRDFVTNVSHELKTPLAAIKAYAETLRMGAINDSENNLGFVDGISKQAELLHRLIGDVIHLARVESGKETFEITTVDMRETIKQCLSQYKTLAEEKNIALIFEGVGDNMQVKADRDGMFAIFSNLLSNAIKYTPEDGQVNVRLRSDGQMVLLEVQDTGIGIDQEHQERVFERFFRVDQARSRDLGGTGLGLAIVKHLVLAFSGKIGVKSDLGMGSTFHVEFPPVKSLEQLSD